MKISLANNHGRTRWRVNIQENGYRKRLFFKSQEEAVAFVQATGGKAKISTTPPQTAATQGQPVKPRSGWNFYD